MSSIVSLSGGKDSSVMVLRMIEEGIPIDRIIFADTTLEFPEMYKWLNKIESLIGITIERVKSVKTWDEWFYGNVSKGRFAGRRLGFPYVVQHCWWSRETKYKLLDKVHKSGDTVYIGIAYNEIKRTMAKQYNKEGIEYRFPLCEWGMTEQDCFTYLNDIGLVHPLEKFKRTGCWLCPKQSMGSLKTLFTDYPDLWEKLKVYEKDSPHGFKPNFSLEDFEIDLIKEEIGI